MRHVLAGSLLVALAVGGCFGGPEGDGPSPGPDPGAVCTEDPLAFDAQGDGHVHTDLADHAVSCNVRLLAHLPLTAQEGEFAGAHSMAIYEDLVAVAVTYGNAGHGFDLIDVRDRGAPKVVGSFREDSATGGDRNLAFSEDGTLIFMANEGARENATGVRVVDVSDPTNPVEESFAIVAPSGVHTIEAFTIDGVQYVAALNYGVHILRLQDVLGSQRLVPVGRYATATPEQIAQEDPTDTTKLTRSVYGHDTTVVKDEATGATLLYFAYAYQGIRVLDISNPSMPSEVGRWTPEPDNGTHYVHAVKPYWLGERRLMVVEAETFEDGHVDTASPIWVVDVTDFEAPEVLYEWTNPGGHGSDRLLFSTHFFEIFEERVYMAHYHGGVWVLDVSVPEDVRVDGYYMPAQDTGYTPGPDCCIGWNLGAMPMTFDVKVDSRGFVHAADLATGYYALEFQSPGD